jgi:Phosphotransferase enzyme family
MTAATDTELLAALPGAVAIERRPYRYATSSRIDELRVRFGDGRLESLLLKDLARSRLLGDARGGKPEFIYEPRREIRTYTAVLAGEAIGARCAASGADWLVLELVDGRELWQVGELEVWAVVARWLAGFHARFAGRVPAVRRSNPYLLAHGPQLSATWIERARRALKDSVDPRAAELDGALGNDFSAALHELAPTLLHGEFYPSNVLVAGELPDLRVCPVDWEMAATGPALIDVAALTTGWDDAQQRHLLAAYGNVDETALDRCRLHLAVQWIGWAPGWTAPAQHAHDWIGEALAAAGRLGLCGF